MHPGQKKSGTVFWSGMRAQFICLVLRSQNAMCRAGALSFVDFGGL